MGAGGSQAAHSAEVRLQHPEVKCADGSSFYARLHTAAEGATKYKAWGQPQKIWLCPDDIITVSIHTAKSEAHFDTHCCEDFAEVYLPWESIDAKVSEGEEVVFRLALSRALPQLGVNASPGEYQASFQQAQDMCKDRAVSGLTVGIQKVILMSKDGEQKVPASAVGAGRPVSPRAAMLASGGRPVSPRAAMLALAGAGGRAASPAASVASIHAAAGRSTSPAGATAVPAAAGRAVSPASAPGLSAVAGRSIPAVVPASAPVLATTSSPREATTASPRDTKTMGPTVMAKVSPSPSRTSIASAPFQSSATNLAGTSPSPSPAKTVAQTRADDRELGRFTLQAASPAVVRQAPSPPRTAPAVAGRQQVTAPQAPRGVGQATSPAVVRQGVSPPRTAPVAAGRLQPQVSTPPPPVNSGQARPLGSSAEVPRNLSPPSRHGIASYGMEELSTEDMRILRQIQVQNLRLRQQLQLSEDVAIPEVNEKMRWHMGRLKEAIYRNFDLRENLQSADKELAMISVNMSKEDRLALSQGGSVGPATNGSIGEDETEIRRHTEKLMAEIQEVTHANIQLIKEYDEEIKKLEKELSAARRQAQTQAQMRNRAPPIPDEHGTRQLQNYNTELQAVQSACQQLQDAIDQDNERKRESGNRTIQKLQTERDVFLEEIEKLKQSLQRDTEEDVLVEDSVQIPATAVLSLEANHLQVQLADATDKGVQEQGALELQADDYRRQVRQHQEQHQKVKAEIEALQSELQELRETRDGAKAAERECAELRENKDKFMGEIGRCKSMVRVYDEKITELKNETSDIRRRVHDVSRGLQS